MGLIDNKKGQTLVEFALVLPLLLFIIFGLIEFGRIFFIYSNLFNATREGTRFGVTSPRDYAGISQKTLDSIVAVPLDEVNVWVWYDEGPDDIKQITDPQQIVPGNRVVVYLEHVVQPLTPLFEPIIPNLKLESLAARTIQSLGTVVSPGPGAPPPPPPGSVVTIPTETPVPTATSTPTPQVSTATPTPLANTPTPTFMPLTPTATPVPAPININEPLLEGVSLVSGTAEPGKALTLRVVQTGLVRTTAADSGGQFNFSDLPALSGGYTVVVQGYGSQDAAVVATPTPTPTVPPKASADPSLSLDPACGADHIQTITVSGYNWPLSSSIKKIGIYWDGQPLDAFKAVTSFSYQFTIYDVTDGAHTVMARTEDNKGNPVPVTKGGAEVTIEFSRPCSAAPLTPTPTIPANGLPDLVIPSLTFTDITSDSLGTYETVRLNATVANIGTTDVTSLFWVDLYMDPSLDASLMEQSSIDYVAINGLAAGSAISFTMYVPGEKLPTTGDHTLVALADTWNQIVELDDENNASTPLSMTVAVQNPVPTPTPTPQAPPGLPGGVEGRTYIYIEDQLQSLGGVSIYVYDADLRLVGSEISDENGFYQVADLPAATYLVVGQVRMGNLIYQDQIAVTVLEDNTVIGADLVLEGVGL